MMTTTISMRVRGLGSPPEETTLALEAALGRIARLETTLAELLLKNERLRQLVGAAEA
jgi:hypothetical protein